MMYFGPRALGYQLSNKPSGLYWRATAQCDLDVGEQFLNFPLHTNLREYSGVDVRGVRSLNQGDQEWDVGDEDQG